MPGSFFRRLLHSGFYDLSAAVAQPDFFTDVLFWRVFSASVASLHSLSLSCAVVVPVFASTLALFLHQHSTFGYKYTVALLPGLFTIVAVGA